MSLPPCHVSRLSHHLAPPWSGLVESYMAWRPSVDWTWWWQWLGSPGWTGALTWRLCLASGWGTQDAGLLSQSDGWTDNLRYWGIARRTGLYQDPDAALCVSFKFGKAGSRGQSPRWVWATNGSGEQLSPGMRLVAGQSAEESGRWVSGGDGIAIEAELADSVSYSAG